MRTNWHARFIELAQHFAGWSKDPSTKVGAVIVDDKRRVLGHGYNGFPRGVKDTKERLNDRPTKYSLVVHAELNAILNTGVPMALEGATLYCTLPPCTECAKAIIQSGITRVVIPGYGWWDESRQAQLERWEVSWQTAEEMFGEAGVDLVVI